MAPEESLAPAPQPVEVVSSIWTVKKAYLTEMEAMGTARWISKFLAVMSLMFVRSVISTGPS